MLTLIEQQDRHAEQRESVIRGLNTLATTDDITTPVFSSLMQVASLAAKSCTTHTALEQMLKMTIGKHLSVSDAAFEQLVALLGQVESWKMAP